MKETWNGAGTVEKSKTTNSVETEKEKQEQYRDRERGVNGVVIERNRERCRDESEKRVGMNMD